MNNLIKYAIASGILGLLITLSSCGSDVVISDQELGLNYFPVESGKSWTYQVDSTIYDELGLNVYTTTTFIRESIKEPILDGSGDTVFILEIAKTKSLDESWNVTDLWTIKKENNQVRKSEENLNFIKLVFPPMIGAEWEGNQFEEDTEVLVAGDVVIVYQDWEYRIVEKKDAYNFLGNQYDDVVIVQMAADSNTIAKRHAFEHYIDGIGMVYKEMEIFDIFCTIDCMEELPWSEKADQGFKVVQKLIDHN